jgi:hypothetical protein
MSGAYSSSRIGLDLDNTLISYDRLFYEVAVERQFIPVHFAGPKREIRDLVRLLPEGEIEWQRLQAHVYGPAIAGARPAEGALDFIRRARAHGAQLAIVSHKSAFANIGASVNLRDAARTWLRENGMVGADAIAESDVYFEDTRADKIARIVSLGCTHFVDDLEEVFDDPAFPRGVERMLLAARNGAADRPYRIYSSFHDIERAFSAC